MLYLGLCDQLVIEPGLKCLNLTCAQHFQVRGTQACFSVKLEDQKSLFLRVTYFNPCQIT